MAESIFLDIICSHLNDMILVLNWISWYFRKNIMQSDDEVIERRTTKEYFICSIISFSSYECNFPHRPSKGLWHWRSSALDQIDLFIEHPCHHITTAEYASGVFLVVENTSNVWISPGSSGSINIFTWRCYIMASAELFMEGTSQ